MRFLLIILLLGACERRQTPPKPVLETIVGVSIIMYDKDGKVYQCEAPWKGNRVVCTRLVPSVVRPDAGPLPAEEL